MALTATREEAGAGSAVHSQPILLAAQNASARIPNLQLTAVTIPTAMPLIASSKVEIKVAVQVGDGVAPEEWTFTEKGSRKKKDLLQDQDTNKNGYTKNKKGNRWQCTRAAPGEKQKCPAKVQENKDGSYTKILPFVHQHKPVPEKEKRKSHDKQLQKPPSKKQK